MPDAFFVWIAAVYGEGAYMAGSKIAGVLCSFADLAMIWMFLKLADAVRKRRSSGWRYRVLVLFATLTPTLFLPETSTHFFILQFFVLGLPYLILAQAVIAEAPHILAHIRKQVESK